MTLIVGIDPGSVHTGFGIIKAEKHILSHIAHGTIDAKGKTVAERLHHIHREICALVASHQPHEAAIEEVFMQINVQSALKLGQARGAALVALAQYALPIAEYSPRVIKKTATGFGAASKEQIQYMVKMQLKLTTMPQADAADALAIAICHAQYRLAPGKIEKVSD
jgi:crossover junction endodeoxyribonuclease RuvC